ncbi:MAG: hypothetical protein ACTTH0_02130, partial [Eubacteriales bacterium]
MVIKDGKYMFVDKDGNKLFSFTEIDKFSSITVGFNPDEIYDFKYGDETAYMKHLGIRAISFVEFEDLISEFSMLPSAVNLGFEFLNGERLLPMSENGKTIYLNKDFEKVMSLKYDAGGLFFDDMAVVLKEDSDILAGYIDKTGK